VLTPVIHSANTMPAKPNIAAVVVVIANDPEGGRQRGSSEDARACQLTCQRCARRDSAVIAQRCRPLTPAWHHTPNNMLTQAPVPVLRHGAEVEAQEAVGVGLLARVAPVAVGGVSVRCVAGVCAALRHSHAVVHGLL
jgi:hypothetical protein